MQTSRWRSQHWAVGLHGQMRWSGGPDTGTSPQEQCSHLLDTLWVDTGNKDSLSVPCYWRHEITGRSLGGFLIFHSGEFIIFNLGLMSVKRDRHLSRFWVKVKEFFVDHQLHTQTVKCLSLWAIREGAGTFPGHLDTAPAAKTLFSKVISQYLSLPLLDA